MLSACRSAEPFSGQFPSAAPTIQLSPTLHFQYFTTSHCLATRLPLCAFSFPHQQWLRRTRRLVSWTSLGSCDSPRASTHDAHSYPLPLPQRRSPTLTYLYSTLSQDEIPFKLRCAICNKLAVNAFRLPCCDQSICEACTLTLPILPTHHA